MKTIPFLMLVLSVVPFRFLSSASAEEAVKEAAPGGHTAHATHEEEYEPTWEISGGANASFINSSFGDNEPSTREFDVVGEFDYFFTNQIEFGVRADINWAKEQENTTSSFAILIGPTYNFSKDVENSFFVQARAGVFVKDQGVEGPNYSRFHYIAVVGKRFEIVPHVSYMPEIGLLGFASTTVNEEKIASKTNLIVTPLQFSFSY